MSSPAFTMGSPNILTGKCPKVSALRPTMNTEKVNMAVRNGDENDENTVASAVTIPTSSSVRLADAASTRRSSGAPSEQANPTTNTTTASGMGRYERQRGSFQAASAPSSSAPNRLPNVTANERPAMFASESSNAPVFMHTNTKSVSNVPRYLPTRYSQRRSGRVKIGKIVLSWSSWYSDVAPRTTATMIP